MLIAENIRKNLPDGRLLLKGINLTLDPGEFVAILGPSGAGKSLSLRCLLNLMIPDSGDVRLRDEKGDWHSLTASRGAALRRIRRKVGVIFQGYNMVKRLTVLDNVLIGRLGRINPLRSWLYGFTDGEAAGAMAALERVGMEGFASRVAGTLSGGEQQRVAIARAIFQEPLVLLADEPVASLDPKNSIQIMRLLQGISQRIPILGVFHQPHLAARFCTRVVGIKDGAVVYNGSPNLDLAQQKMLYGDELDQLQDETGMAAKSQECEPARPLAEMLAER